MNFESRRGRVVFWIVGVVLLVGVVASTAHMQEFLYRPHLNETLYLPSGRLLDHLSLGYRQVVADFVWFSAVQYYGDYRKGKHSLAYFEGLMNIVTTLDPNFVFAYVFTAWVLSEDLGEFDSGINMLRMGMKNNPTSWELPFEIGFLNFTNRADFELAGRYLELSSRMPGAPERAKRFAAFVYSKAGETESSIRLWEAYREYTDNPYLREMADRYIERLRRGETIPGSVSK